ncbi:hypothetical protein BD413DRAFT_489676 [Trametes elegans]|nr:hypothetical protein BD413DRAFT_489676 [Trametes elegans]
MPSSEIDAIFASNGKASATASTTASSSSYSQATEKKKKKKKDKSAKRKRDDADADADGEPDDAAPAKLAKRKVPETVFDPSAALPALKEPKPRKADKTATGAAKPKKPKQAREEEERFKDSRGTGPRRKTEEGFSIYKEDELGISHEGGDTPLCPFDCQCCEPIASERQLILTCPTGF